MLCNVEGREMQLWKITESSPAFDRYLARVQTLALWYVDAAQYTDNEDPRWNHYFVQVLFPLRTLTAFSSTLSRF